MDKQLVGGIAVLILIAAAFGGLFVWIAKTHAPAGAPAGQIIAPALSPDLDPLYSGASWSDAVVENLTISTTSYSGAGVTSVPVTNTMDPGSIFTPFDNYYASKLAALGWQVDNAVAAGGHTGGQTGYRKDGKLILINFDIVYHTVTDTAPSECPCDVTLSLFSEK